MSRILEHLTPGGVVLGLAAGLLAGGFVRVEIPFHHESIEPQVITEPDALSVGDSEKKGQLVLPDEFAKIRFMEWMGASATDYQSGETLEVSIIVEKSYPGALHRTETLGKRVIVRGAKSLRDVTIGDVLNQLPIGLPTVEKPVEESRYEKGDDADNDAADQIGGDFLSEHFGDYPKGGESVNEERGTA